MFSRRLKTGYFLLEGMNSFASVYYLYYFFFLMQKGYGFGNKANLALAALNGLLYALFAWWGGKFGQRFGYFNALKLGFGSMMLALLLGGQVSSALGQVLVMCGMISGLCFTWPSLEALISEGETPAGVQHMVGIYNIVWAGTAAVSYFIGGALLEHLGFKSLFYLPVSIQLVQLGLTFWLEGQARRSASSLRQDASEGTEPAALDSRSTSARGQGSSLGAAAALVAVAPVAAPAVPHRTPANAKAFLRMAWLANPFAYIAINTLIAVIPGVARRLELSTMAAGFCCSVWCFARLGAFVGLWCWSGWHYRFRWLLSAYLALVGSFAAILLVPNLAVLVGAEILFGVAIGLIYYSSLFYSMDSSDTKGEHGGIHEAAIGLGNFAGPAVGAAALQLLPQYSTSGAVAVSLLLLGGLGGLAALWRQGKT